MFEHCHVGCNLAGGVGIVNENGERFCPQIGKMSATALRAMTVHHGCFEDVSAVIDVCPLCSVSCVAWLSFEVDHLASGQSVIWDQRDIACPLFLNQKIAVMHWSEPSLITNHLCYCIPGIWALGANDPVIGTPFAKAGCLQQLSGLAASCSMHRSQFLLGLLGSSTLHLHLWMGATSTSSSTMACHKENGE